MHAFIYIYNFFEQTKDYEVIELRNNAIKTQSFKISDCIFFK